ncbi:MAG: metal ABC transporter permease [Eubacteriales bacterium]
MTISEIFASEFLTKVVIRALVVGVLVSLCSSMLGVSLVLKRYSMIGDGLSHVGFFALAVASVAGVGATYSIEVSVPIVILAAVLILRLSHSDGKLNGDAACAVVSTGAVAIGTIMYNFTGGRSGDICNSLFGSSSVVTISTKDMAISIVLSVLVLVWFVIFSKNIFAVTFDETFAHAAGVRTNLFNLSLAVLTGITIVVGMKMMGSIMISALIVFPALTAMQLTKSFRLTVILSSGISIVCFVVGFFAACCLSLQTGAAVVTVELVVFAAALVGVRIKGMIYKSKIKAA